MFSSLPRVSTLTRAHGHACCSPGRRPMTHAAAPQVLQREAQLARGPPGRHLMASCHDGADGRHPQLDGGPAGTADPAPHRARRDIEVTRDPPVPGPQGSSDQGLPDQPGRPGATRQQPGIEHDVRDLAARAQRPVGPDPHQLAAQVADRTLAGPPPRLQGLAAVRAAQLAASQRIPGRRGVEDLDHRPSRHDHPRLLTREGAARVALWHPQAAHATRSA
jgi:hypothetical protein